MLFLAVLFLLGANVHAANILSIIIFPSWSHQQPLLSISRELSQRGHNLTVITANPPKEFVKNWKTIDISSTYESVGEFGAEYGFSLQREWPAYQFVTYLAPLLRFLSNYTLSLPQVQEFIRNADLTHYDLVIYENFMFSSYGGLVHKIGSPPVVGIHTLPPLYPTDWAMGVPINPSYIPDTYVGYTDRMDFFQRVYNTVFYWWMKYQWEMRILPMQDEVLKIHFGSDLPSAREFEYNKSLVIIPTDLTMAYPQPLPPNLIQIGPLHLKPAKPLPKDLKEWLDGAEDGVVYFSLGSIMQGKNLRPDKRNVFVQTFAKFPKMRFMWKWESDEKIPGLPSNVITRKWFPQQDVFAYKNLRLIIMQGGLQSLQESMEYGIPILGIPLFSDQSHNTWKISKEGVGVSLDMHEVNEESLYKVLKKLLYDEAKSFKENATRLSKIAKDQILPAMDTAVWWIEYVIRHNGARHLRMASFDLTWYQLGLIDVYAFLLVTSLFIIYLVYFVSKILFSCFKSPGKTSRTMDKKKKNK